MIAGSIAQRIWQGIPTEVRGSTRFRQKACSNEITKTEPGRQWSGSGKTDSADRRVLLFFPSPQHPSLALKCLDQTLFDTVVFFDKEILPSAPHNYNLHAEPLMLQRLFNVLPSDRYEWLHCHRHCNRRVPASTALECSVVFHICVGPLLLLAEQGDVIGSGGHDASGSPHGVKLAEG